MNDIEELKKSLTDNDPEIRVKAVETLTKMASEGNKEAAEILHQVIKNETNLDVLKEIFKLPIQSDHDKRYELIEDFNDAPFLERLDKSNYKNLFIDWLKDAIKVFDEGGISYHPKQDSLLLLYKLLNKHDLLIFIDNYLKFAKTHITLPLESLTEIFSNKEYSDIFQKIISHIKKDPNAYSKNFIKIFNFFLLHPHPDTVKSIKELWISLPPNFKEAVKLYYYNDYYNEIVRYFRNIERNFNSHIYNPVIINPMIISKHPILQWLESFEQGIVTSSPSSYFILQDIAEKIGFHLKDEVEIIETEEPSPITLESRRKENIELIPIDKFLGLYIPQKQLIILYMKEIREIAKRFSMSLDELKTIVEYHESAHAIVHLGRDAEGINFNTGAYNMVDNGADPSPLHETLAQLLTYHCVKNNSKLLDCFIKLNRYQPNVYTLWENYKDVSLELIRNIVLGMRQGRIEATFKMFESLTI